MNIILQQDYHSLGYVGDQVKVKPGYARNFLIPRGIAVEAIAQNEALLKHRLTSINAKKVKLKAQATEYATRLEALKLEFTIRVGAGGRSFGSVSVKEIEAALKEKGFELDKRQIRLSDQIKKGGDYTVFVKLHSEVTASVALHVNAEGASRKAETTSSDDVSEIAPDAPKERKKKAKKAKKEDSSTEDTTETTPEPTEIH